MKIWRLSSHFFEISETKNGPHEARDMVYGVCLHICFSSLMKDFSAQLTPNMCACTWGARTSISVDLNYKTFHLIKLVLPYFINVDDK